MTANIGRMFYEGAVPWHGLGKKVEHSLTWKDAIVEAGLDWTVAKSSVQFDGGVKLGHNLGLETFKGRSVTYRTDNQQPIGIVSDDYTIVQNKEAGQILDSVVGEVGAHYHTAGYLGNGSKVWMLIKLPGFLKALKDDVIEKYLLCANGHDGLMSFWILETPIRVVCQNTLMAAIQGKSNHRFRAVHSKEMVLDAKTIREKLGYADEKFNVLEQAYQKMAKKSFTSNRELDYFKEALDWPRRPGSKMQNNLTELDDDKASSRMKNRLKDLLDLFEGGKGTEIKGVKGTVWGAYNAVVEYSDYFGNKDNQKRANSTLFGSGAQMKERAFNLAMELVS